MRQLIGLVLLGLAAVGQAQEIQGGYVGLSVGAVSYEEDDENLGLALSDTSSAYRVFGGYQINSNYAVEAGWGVTGEIQEGFRASDPFLGDVSLDITREYEIATLRVLALAPFSSASMFGGAGFYDATLIRSLRYEDDLQIIAESFEESDSGVTVVGGVQLELDRITVRGEYEWFDTDGNIDASIISVSALFRF